MKKNPVFVPAVPQTVGAIMSREPLMLSPVMRAREALVRLRQVGVPKDFMTNCYVVDQEYRLLGLVPRSAVAMLFTGLGEGA